MARTAVLIAVVVGSLTLGAQEPQQQAPVFRGTVSTVSVPVTVFDLGGNLVNHLQRDDFQVFDNGERQPLTNFLSGLQPITVAALLDTSASMTVNLEFARSSVERFIARLRPGDKAIVSGFNSRLFVPLDFTEDRDALIRALHHDLPFGNPTRLFDAIDDALNRLEAHGGRRVILLFTDGCDAFSEARFDTVRDRLMTSDVMVYAVQIRSRIQMMRQMRMVNGCEPHYDLELPPAVPMRDLMNINDGRRTLSPTQVLQRMTGDTGGGHFLLTTNDDLNATFTRVADELHHLYLLGFAPQKLDGKVHDLVVRVRGRDLRIRARRSYLAPLAR